MTPGQFIIEKQANFPLCQRRAFGAAAGYWHKLMTAADKYSSAPLEA